MLAEMKEEAIDICTVAIEKNSADLEKATQVLPWARCNCLGTGKPLPVQHALRPGEGCSW